MNPLASRTVAAFATAATLAFAALPAAAQEKVTFLTNWYARPNTAASTRPWRPGCTRSTGWT